MSAISKHTLPALRALAPASLVQLGAWKARQATRRTLDALGGSRRLAGRGRRWGLRWLADNPRGIQAWLNRPEAGVWWFDGGADEWARASATEADLKVAEAAERGEFDLIGSGPIRLGSVPAWRRDLYSGLEWPLEPSARLRLARGDGSDVRTVWELSRCYHFVALARSWQQTGDARFAEAFARHALSFEDQNPPALGPHWASPMDVAIRSANWCLAVPLFAEAPLPREFWARLLGQLWLSGLYIERHLEWHPVYRGNHFVANLVGLVYLGTLFRGTRAGERWLRVGGARLVSELEYQVGADGVSFEGSLAYHRLVAELFGWAGELLRRNQAAFDCDVFDRTLRRMSAFIAAYLQPDGRAPMIGDADDGHLHVLEPAAEPRQHAVGLPGRYAVPAPADGAFAFPESGFYVLRHGADHAVIRCGPVGLKGAGSHDHNDQLGFELVIGGRRFVSDSGTFAYTRDLAARYAFRATAAHSVVQLDGEEQNPIAPDRPWRVLADRTRSRTLACEATGGELRYRGEHYGFAHLAGGATCSRELHRDAGGGWQLTDEISGSGEADVCWRLQLATLEHSPPERTGAVVRIACPGSPTITLLVRIPEGCALRVDRGQASDAYGSAYDRAVVVVAGRVRLPLTVQCSMQLERG